MKVFHGTGNYAVPDITTGGLRKRLHPHVSKPCACTSLDFDIAKLFAVRKSSSEDFIAGKITGVILEFEMKGRLGKDYLPVRDTHSLQEEREIAVFSPRCLRLIAVWKYDQEWERCLVI